VRKPGGKMPEYVRQGSSRSFAPPNGISGFKFASAEVERCKTFPLDDLDNRYYYYIQRFYFFEGALWESHQR
jgi:hypothetical protein